MAYLSRIWQLVFPPRAQTQTWMFLTFALFVGLAVAGVGSYVLFILRTQIRDAVEVTYSMELEHVLETLAGSASLAEQLSQLDDRSRSSGIRVLLMRQDSLVWTSGPEMARAAVSHMRSDRAPGLEPDETYFSRLRLPDGTRINLGAAMQQESGLLVAILQPEHPFHSVALDMQWTLIFGMIMALLMALAGSWIASDRVTTPLLAIGKSADNIARGKLETPIRVTTRSAEIQDLATNLDRMSVSYRQKIGELQRVTRIQSEFIGNVSHEVRNPIFSISGYLEALGSSKLSDEMRSRYAAKGLLNLQRLGNLFNDLIEIARLEYREDLLETTEVDLAGLVHEVSETMRPKANERGIRLATSSRPLHVLADRNRIRQVLVNLLDNAVAYSDAGVVECLYHRQDDKVRIEVADDGQGISEEHLGRIFDRFYRVDPARTRKSGGSGLGLSIVKQILHAHGEKIHVDSRPGDGSRFWFHLPAADAA